MSPAVSARLALADRGKVAPGLRPPPEEGPRLPRNNPDPLITGVGDHQVARPVRGRALRETELGAGGRAPVPGKTKGTVARHIVDTPGGQRPPVEGARLSRDNPDPLITGIGEPEDSRARHPHPLPAAEL